MRKAIFHILSIKNLTALKDLICFYNERGIKIETEGELKTMSDVFVTGLFSDLIHVSNSLGLNGCLCIVKGCIDVETPGEETPGLLLNPVYFLNKFKPTFGTDFKISNYE